MLSLKTISNKKLFGLSILLGFVIVLAFAAYIQWQDRLTIKAKYLAEGIAVTEQLRLKDISLLNQREFKTIIDLRPDGEASDQPSSSIVETVVRANKMEFVYVPVPHGDIPDSAVDALAKALSTSPKPILMYCRSGKRAARTWSLVEASRVGGSDAKSILFSVQRSGQSADDLEAAIKQRIANRKEGSL